MKCPSCNEFLVMADKNGVEIDYCPKCRGIWLDKGELEKIMERTNQHYSNRDNYEKDYHEKSYVPRHDDDYRHSHNPQHPHPHKKKKSFFDEMFDFD